jgi:hypothetical protein
MRSSSVSLPWNWRKHASHMIDGLPSGNSQHRRSSRKQPSHFVLLPANPPGLLGQEVLLEHGRDQPGIRVALTPSSP